MSTPALCQQLTASRLKFAEDCLKKKKPAKRKPGRPPISSAVAHDRILDVVFMLLQTRSVHELTIEQVCLNAGVSKPTIYRWWPSKAALVMDMFDQRLLRQPSDVKSVTAEQSIRTKMPEMIEALNGFFGKIATEMIVEGQSDPAILREFRNRFVVKRRAIWLKLFNDAFASGEFKNAVNPELLADVVFGALYYRLLVKHQPLDQRFGKMLVDFVLAGVA